MNGVTLFVVALAYAIALFGLAAWAERRRERIGPSRWRVPVYTLGLAVYCSSWTYYGAVGTAVVEGWRYLPIYLGPILVYLLAPGFLRRLIDGIEREGAASISDFIGSRFGKSRGVAALVTLLALLGTVPYLALQLRSVGMSYAEIAGGGAALASVVTAGVLAAFAILFGTRRYNATARNEGVLVAIAVESLVKLAALVGVGVFALWLFGEAPAAAREAGLARLSANFAPGGLNVDFLVILLLSSAAIVCLPRQFYMGVIGAGSPRDVDRARLPFVGYLALTALVVVPIATAGLTLLPPGTAPDLYVLDLPLAAGARLLALVVFVGGFSAATAMVVVETIALSTMLSNDLVAPLLLRSARASAERDLGRLLLHARRAAIVAVMVAALAYALLLPAGGKLADLGLIAFAAMIQFAPALVLAVYGGGRDAAAAKAGLTVGLALWLWTLLLPTMLPRTVLAALAGGAFDPVALVGLAGLDPLTHGVAWSLGANVVVFALVAARRARRPALPVVLRRRAGIAQARDLGSLVDIAGRFAEPHAIARAFGPTPERSAPIDARSARIAERLIAGVVGAPSARAIMATALSGATLKLADVARMLDEGGQSLHFSKGLLAATLENIDPGVSVVDRDLNLVAWNSRYLELFAYPPGMVRVGAPVADLIRYNARRGEFGAGGGETQVERRLDHMRAGRVHSFERRRPDGRVLKTVGGPMPGGGYVMCFTDTTAEARAIAELVAARAELETRVAERTRDLRVANAALAQATRDKTRFLAAASHDLLQPLHAARLFSAALARDVPARARPTLANMDRSIAAADELLRALLDISKLDAGGITPQSTCFALRPLVEELAETFAPLAGERGLRLRVGPGDATVETDRTLLRSMLQNLLSNAIRYTARGGVLVGVRPRGGRAAIDVVDSGAGIAPADHRRIFGEFERLGVNEEGGAGLGLAIVERTARLLRAELALRSVPGRGSRFSIVLPRAEGVAPADAPRALRSLPARAGATVLVVDDEADVREATASVLTAWGYAVRVAADAATALAQCDDLDAALVDLQLGDGIDGLAVIARLRARNPRLRAALVTADRVPTTAARAARAGVPLFLKPLAPERLAAWLAGDARAAAE